MKTSSVRIAALYWPTTSVGGINSELQYYKRAAQASGDRFDILRSANANSPATLYGKPKRIRGGDTFIDVDGQAGHAPTCIAKTLQFLKDNYDALFFVSLVPHPNKMYEEEPNFLPIFTDTPTLPKAASISDGYWHSYSTWGKQAAVHVKVLYTGCAAYAIPVVADGIAVQVRPRPFYPPEVLKSVPRSKDMLTVWTSQWKDIKGIVPFLKVVPRLPGRVELYSTGIRYYQTRTTDIWKNAVGKDLWRKGFDGHGKATYYGWVPLDKTPEIYSRAWFSVNLQGITARPGKTSLFGSVVANPHAVYSGGSWNNTESESLYYGAIPVLHKQVLKSNLPKNLILTVERAEDLPDLFARKDLKSWVFDLNRVMEARCWVQQHQDPVRLYREMKEALFV